MTGIKEAFGEEFEKSYEAEKKSKIPRLNITGVLKRELLATIKQKMKGGVSNTMTLIGSNLYHLVLVETNGELIRNKFPESKFGTGEYMKGINWAGKMVSINSNDSELLDMIKPNSQYVLVGVMKVKPAPNNRSYYNFRVDGVITMDDIVEYNKSIGSIVEQDLE